MSVRVLMVEDDEGDAYLFRRYLKSVVTRYEIDCAVRVSEARSAIEQTVYDIILLDLTLPDCHGLETLTTVRATTETTPIVLLTGVADESLAVSCLRAGAQDYLVKQGITAEVLERTIRHAMERMRIERALKQSEAEFHGLFEQAPHGICRSDAAGKLFDVNRAFISMLRFESKEQALGLNLIHDIYVHTDEHGRMIETRHESDRLVEHEAEWRRGDGEQITVRLSGRVVRGEDDTLQCFEMVAEDVTERLALEEQVRQTQKMDAVGQLAGGVAHEINNLLSIILTDTELIQRALPHDLDEVTKDVSEVREVAIRGGKLIKRLLGFSRRQRLTVEVVELDVLVADTVDMLRRLVPESVEVGYTAEGPQGRIRIDSATVEQILFNLTTNARDAMPDGGQLNIVTGSAVHDAEYCLQHPGSSQGPVVYIRVSDSGAGMDEETRRSVFEPFFSTKPKGKGTGLGLSTVYGLVKQQAGYISIDSEPGIGTTLEIFFPQVDEATTKIRRSPGGGKSRPKGTETILVVEDEAELRRAAQRVLERFGYKVIVAADGLEGLDRYRENSDGIDLVLSDVVMPKMGGPAFIEKLMVEFDSDFPAVILMSGYSSENLRCGELLDGRYVLLEKPWELTTLLDTVRGVLDTWETEDPLNRSTSTYGCLQAASPCRSV